MLKILYFIFFYFLTLNPSYSDLFFEGLSKLDEKDIQALTEIDIYKDNYSKDEINKI